MKALKIPSNAHHIVLLEEGDRFIHLEGLQTAVVIDEDKDEQGKIQVSVHFPDVPEGEEIPFPMLLSACVREFLDDPDWVMLAKERLNKKHNKQA